MDPVKIQILLNRSIYFRFNNSYTEFFSSGVTGVYYSFVETVESKTKEKIFCENILLKIQTKQVEGRKK